MLYFQLPLIKPYVQFSRIRLSNHLLPWAFAACLAFRYSFRWRSWIFSGVFSIYAISFTSLLKKRDEGIAPSLSQGYVVLELHAVPWATPTPLQTRCNFVPLYPPVALLLSICKGLPCYPVWLPLRVTPATPEVHLSVLAVFVSIGVSAFLFWPQGRQLLIKLRGYL